MPSPDLHKPKLWESEKHERKLFEKIQQAHRAGQNRRANYFSGLYLKSIDAKHVAAHDANKVLKRHRKVKNCHLLKIASTLNPWRGTTEEVIVNLRPKKSNSSDFRVTMDFGIEHRTMQILVRRVLEARTELSSSQFLMFGGCPVAAKAVLKNLAEGYNWTFEFDIQNCYPSFKNEQLANILPLPKEVSEHIITTNHFNMTPGNIAHIFGSDHSSEDTNELLELFNTEEFSEVRRGIPQGSSASPYVTEVLLAPIFTILPDCGRVVNFVDNFLVMARNYNDAELISSTLRDALLGHPAGPLQPKIEGFFPPGKTIIFLGYQFQPQGNSYLVTPSSENLHKFEMDFMASLDKAMKAHSLGAAKRQLAHLRKHVRRWSRGFSVWDGADAWRERKLAIIEGFQISLTKGYAVQLIA